MVEIIMIELGSKGQSDEIERFGKLICEGYRIEHVQYVPPYPPLQNYPQLVYTLINRYPSTISDLPF